MTARMRWLGLSCTYVMATAVLTAQGSDSPDLAMYARIREEGQTRSRIMRYASEFAAIPRATTPAALQVMAFLRRRTGPIVPKAEHPGISAVFTVDAGGGRIRGVSVGSRTLVPLFQSWIAPLRDLGVTMVSPNSDCGGDCKPFADAGLPVPVFTHDPLDYETRTHHTNMDTYEYLQEDDLKQAAVVLASVAYSVAARDGVLPRQP